MSFFNAIKKSFGLDNDPDDGLLEDSVDTPAPERRPVHDHPQPSHTVTVSDQPIVDIDKDKATLIFGHVVDLFNQAMPSFIKDSVDPEKQSRLIYETLDKSLKQYLETIALSVRNDIESQHSAEQESLRSEMENLRIRAKEIEQQRFDIKQQQLSADRQRRALSDRVHDLEAQIGALEAEREQYDLENKSLLNKLKVAGIHESETETLRSELDAARAEIVALKNGAVNGDSTTLGEDFEKLNKALSAKEDLLVQKETELAETARRLEELEKSNEDLRAKLNEADSVKADVVDLNEQIRQIDSLMSKRDAKIERLTKECDDLTKLNASLKETIAANLKEYAVREEKLLDKIAGLEADTAHKSDSEATTGLATTQNIEDTTPKISDGDLAEIEESFDTAEWLCSNPPHSPSLRTEVNEADFGYQAPAHKQGGNDNEAQLSLF